MDKDYKVWLYCRVAQHDEDAMLRQEKLLRDSAEDYHEIIGVTHEYGSGLDIDRPGLREVQAKAREGIVVQILVIRMDRICRNGLLAKQWIQDTIHYGVSVGMLQGDGRLTHITPPKIEHVAYYIRVGNETHAGIA